MNNSVMDNLIDTFLSEDSDELEMMKLFNLALKQMPGSPLQKKILKKLNDLRRSKGLKPIGDTQYGK